MLVWLDFRVDALDGPVWADHEGRADDAHELLALEAILAPRAEGLRQHVIGIGQEALREAVLPAEFDVALNGVGADPKDLDTGLLEHGVAIAQTARLFRSTRGIVG